LETNLLLFLKLHLGLPPESPRLVHNKAFDSRESLLFTTTCLDPLFKAGNQGSLSMRLILATQ